ncbi:MAG: thiamine pyrophosphate-dependent enzyme [Chloroflexota bacterium]
MQSAPITATPSQIMVEQLAASGIKHLFYNSGSREALFFDALQQHPDIHGVLALHEGSVASMAGGYAQTALDPAVMVVHLGAGLAQCLGQFINIWHGSLPVVVITFAGDTGSFADRINLDLSHNFGPTSIAAPMMKANWTIIEPEGLPHAIHRAIQVAKTPPVGPVHLAIYDRMLGHEQTTAHIIHDSIADLRSGYPDAHDIAQVAEALEAAERPMLFVGDGVWKSGGEAPVALLAERFGLPIVTTWGERRSVPFQHPLHCGRIDLAAAEINPDLILCIGARHNARGNRDDFNVMANAERVIAIGADVANLKNLGGLDLAILADEGRTAQRIIEWLDAKSGSGSENKERKAWAEGHAATLRNRLVKTAEEVSQSSEYVRPRVLGNQIDSSLEKLGGGIVTVEQFAVPLDCVDEVSNNSRNIYLQAPGASEGWGVGAPVGAKLAAPDKTVVGLVGDGSFCYADSGSWSAAHHNIPVLYVIPNNGAYGIVASSFHRAEGTMAQTGEYAGVTLSNIDPVKIAEGFGIEARYVQNESELEEAFEHGLKVVNEEGRPYLLNVQLPLGLPSGGRTAKEFSFGDAA